MKKANDGYFIGIDSGGTKCRIIICGQDKKIIFSKDYEGIHYSIAGAIKFGNTVLNFIKDSLKKSKLNISRCKGICLGVAGAREKKDRECLRRIFTEKLSLNNIIVSTDAMTALYGAFEGGEGIILISGTGSVLYGYSKEKSGGEILRVGGWGRLIGDEGSGYMIGKSALNLLTKEFDQRRLKKNKSLFSRKVNEVFGIDSSNLNEKIYGKNFQMQLLVPLILECAKKRCPICVKAVDEAIKGLVSHMKLYLKISKRKAAIHLAFIGSVIENKNILSENLKKEIVKEGKVKVVKKKHSPAFGAALIAIEKPDLLNKF